MIRKITLGRFAVLAAVVVVAAIAAPMYAFGGGNKPIKNAEATLETSGDVVVGTVHLKQEGSVVQVKAKFDAVPAGFHGFHIHTLGGCTGDFVASAGGHLNPGAVNHAGHAGDMPVLLVNADGTAEASFETDRFSVDELIDANGSAIIVHALADNYANIPASYGGPVGGTLNTGDAGGRFACGVVETDTD